MKTILSVLSILAVCSVYQGASAEEACGSVTYSVSQGFRVTVPSGKSLTVPESDACIIKQCEVEQNKAETIALKPLEVSQGVTSADTLFACGVFKKNVEEGKSGQQSWEQKPAAGHYN